ncbi:alkyldihydroxyacetonephosphate synthaseperoxisomal [Aphelenchoides avenae]|nr:alkyldihydroxyacetonephosphate synthaseperoxisomal [Aphelenchus avenae]
MTGIHEFNAPDTYRDRILKWNGWGYSDSYFALNEQGEVKMTGDRYEISEKVIPLIRPWFEQNLGVDISHKTPSKDLKDIVVPEATVNKDFLDYLTSNGISFSDAPKYRLVRGHGHTVHDMIALRTGEFDRIPDVVAWPRSEADIEKVVEGANRLNVVIIPIGGGTSVSNALNCPPAEARTICSLDMALLNKVLYIDEANLVCRAQAGIVGQDLEKQLNDKGFTCGHEPDSVEFSTLGGWVATRASGMKKNRYGNIEDLLVHVNIVTSKGVLRRSCQVPRLSAGPDLHQIILGSEGTYGVVSERCQPASLRLVDNEQFIMGQAMKLKSTSLLHDFSSKLSKLYVTKWKGFKVTEMVAATCVFEGTQEEVSQQQSRLNAVAAQFGGIASGEENGRYGYRLTFAIAYLRDLGMEYGIVGESFETSVPWDKVETLCRNVKELLKREVKAAGVTLPALATCRVTQVYDAGACIYFYFGFNTRGLKNPLEVYDHIEAAARDEIIACGGSISHHHGVGKLRKRWLPQTVGQVGISVLKRIKEEVDPNNVFGSGNLIDAERSKL